MDKSQEEILAKDKTWIFDTIDVFYIAGRGKAFSIKNPVTCIDFDWIINKECVINGTTHKIVGVEKFQHSPPWRKGESISLLVSAFEQL